MTTFRPFASCAVLFALAALPASAAGPTPVKNLRIDGPANLNGQTMSNGVLSRVTLQDCDGAGVTNLTNYVQRTGDAMSGALRIFPSGASTNTPLFLYQGAWAASALDVWGWLPSMPGIRVFNGIITIDGNPVLTNEAQWAAASNTVVYENGARLSTVTPTYAVTNGGIVLRVPQEPDYFADGLSPQIGFEWNNMGIITTNWLFVFGGAPYISADNTPKVGSAYPESQGHRRFVLTTDNPAIAASPPPGAGYTPRSTMAASSNLEWVVALTNESDPAWVAASNNYMTAAQVSNAVTFLGTGRIYLGSDTNAPWIQGLGVTNIMLGAGTNWAIIGW